MKCPKCGTEPFQLGEMATIPNGMIQLFLSEQEADIIQQALCRYEGPYRKDGTLNDHETARSEAMVKVAEGIIDVIQAELHDRYIKSQHIEISYGR